MGILTPDMIGLSIGMLITLMIGSYLIGDNFVYRLALAVLVGLGVGYAFGTSLLYLKEWVVAGFGGGGQPNSLWLNVYHLAPLFLGVLLLFKGFSPASALGKLTTLGDIPMGFLVGVGAAVAVAGALVGTLAPQMLETGAALTLANGPLRLLEGAVVAVGTVVTLLLFSPRPIEASGKSQLAWRGVQQVGRGFVVIALGTVFAGLLTSALTQLVMRLWDMVYIIFELLKLVGG